MLQKSSIGSQLSSQIGTNSSLKCSISRYFKTSTSVVTIVVHMYARYIVIRRLTVNIVNNKIKTVAWM